MQWDTNNAPPQVADTTGALEPFGEFATTALTPFNVNTQSIRARFWDGHDHVFRDDVTTLHGNHLIQFGGSYQHNWDHHQRTDNGGGINYTLTYQLGDSWGSGEVSLADAVALGLPSGIAAARDFSAVTGIVTDAQTVYTRSGPSLVLNPPMTPAFDEETIPFYNVYVSDTWRIKPSLTITYGLRWTLEMPPHEAQGKQVELVDSSNQPLDGHDRGSR